MAEDIRAGKLKEIDILVMPGGNSWRQVATIGAEHEEKIHTFLKMAAVMWEPVPECTMSSRASRGSA